MSDIGLSNQCLSIQQSGAAEACWAHNPEVDGSKPSSATYPAVMKASIHSVSRVAQRKRAGPITQRSMDRNHPLLLIQL
ncbi:unnamed protein product [Clavelina lepadiformis]|uniref:Uncharacterized protein n=1 Tax=Clavelina lepadiformis TaxID=159417 RepID=A0ABP0FWU0_CLALP